MKVLRPCSLAPEDRDLISETRFRSKEGIGSSEPKWGTRRGRCWWGRSCWTVFWRKTWWTGAGCPGWHAWSRWQRGALSNFPLFNEVEFRTMELSAYNTDNIYDAVGILQVKAGIWSPPQGSTSPRSRLSGSAPLCPWLCRASTLLRWRAPGSLFSSPKSPSLPAGIHTNISTEVDCLFCPLPSLSELSCCPLCLSPRGFCV